MTTPNDREWEESVAWKVILRNLTPETAQFIKDDINKLIANAKREEAKIAKDESRALFLEALDVLGKCKSLEEVALWHAKIRASLISFPDRSNDEKV